MTYDLQPSSTELDWSTVNRWADVIDDDFTAGEWVAPRQLEEGVFVTGFVALSEQAAAFVQELYDQQVIADFDWPEWMQGRGRRLHGSPDLLADASLDDCRRLLIALVRGDRFNEGLLLQAFEDGEVSRILHRIRDLTESTAG